MFSQLHSFLENNNPFILLILFFFLLSINQIDERHISQDQTQKINFLRDPLLEDRFIGLGFETMDL